MRHFGFLALLFSLGFAWSASAHTENSPAGEDASAPLARIPAGHVRARVTLPLAVSPASFLEARSLFDQRLSERLGHVLELALRPGEIDALRDEGVTVDVVPEESLERMTNPTAYTYARMVSEIQALEAAHPQVVRITEHTNATHEGRTIYEIKLSDNVDVEEDEPTVFFLGVHHGGEMIGCDIIMFWMTETLAGYGSDPVKTGWIDDHEIRVIVIGNPDGWMNNETGITSGWRKNKRDNNASGSFETNADGVDINRNFDFGWLLNGSGNPASSIYRGPSPASEPEAQVCQNLLLANKPVLAVSWHMSGEIVYMPWTINGANTPDHPAYFDFAKSIGDAIPRQSGVGTYPPVVETRYGGFIDDWIYGVTGGFCVTPEVSWSQGSVPISTVIANNQNAYPVVFQRIAGPQITGLVTDAVSGTPLAARVQILEINTFELPARTSDASHGRYRWLTLPGTYSLRVSRVGYHARTASSIVVTGAGPTRIDIPLVPHYSKYGAGLAGSAGQVPQLTGSGTPAIGATVSADLSDGVGGALAVFALGGAPASLPLFGGTLLVAPPLTTKVVLLTGAPGVPGAGSGSFVGSIPSDPSLQGQTFYFQAAVLDSAAAQGKALTSGLAMHIE